MMNKRILFLLAFPALTLHSCISDDIKSKLNKHGNISADEYFDFKTSRILPLNINYGTNGYKTLFSVYSENPIDKIIDEDNNYCSLKKITPLLNAYTDKHSIFNGSIYLPSNISKVWIYTEFYGHYNIQEIAITSSGISYDATKKDKVINRNSRSSGDFKYGFTSQSGTQANPYSVCDKLGKWNNYGLIDGHYIDNDFAMKSASIISRVQRVAPGNYWSDNSKFVKGKEYTNLVTYRELKYNDRTQQMEGGTEIKLHFMWEWASYHSALGYYYYPKGKSFTEEEFKALPKYIALPNCTWDETYAGNSNAGKRKDNGHPLHLGSTIQLKYFGKNYDEDGSKLFPANVEIGWFFMADVFSTGKNNGYKTDEGNINGYMYGEGLSQSHNGNRYKYPYVFSNEEFNGGTRNTGKKEAVMTLHDVETNTLIMGFEDGDAASFSDVLFSIEATPGVINPGWPEISTKPEDNVNTIYRGAIAFEDNWPLKGDYDMNDAIVNYKSNIITDSDNNIIKIVDEFTPIWNGANYTNGFGYELGIDRSLIESVNIDRNGASCSFDTTDGLENGQGNRSVIMLYDNQSSTLNKKITVTTTIKNDHALKFEDLKFKPPYNPFLVEKSNNNYSKGRLEIHLPKVFPPTNLADGLDTMDDISGNNIWYVSKPDEFGVQYPFAITIPFSDTYNYFIPVTETKSITIDYPSFKEWTKSNGEKYTSWYLHNSKN